MKKVALFYLMMLSAHVAHVFEETWGRFWMIGAIYGLEWFLVVNWVLFSIPIVFFYFVLQRKRSAYYGGILYAGIMILNGIGHNAATLEDPKGF